MASVEHRASVANLPPILSSLVGRKHDITRIANSLCEENVRLLTLTGAAGVGKTRLAVEVAFVAAPAFTDGVWFVDLGALTEPDLVTHAVTLTGGLREEQGYTLLDTLTGTLQSKRFLLVLDNCEHLIGPCATLAEHLLSACPHLQILITSRRRLGITSETTWPVHPLSLPDPSDALSIETISGYDAIRLFVERAMTVLPDFQLTELNSAAVIRICSQLDGIPLALELAAGWITTLTVDQIALRLDDRLRLLSNRNPLAPPRQQTLRGAVEWSYDLLSIQDRTLFDRLSVFSGGCSLDAIEAVCTSDGIEPPDILHLLDRLVAQSLVLAEDSHREKRYRVLETLRLFGRERLVINGGAEKFRTRHATHFLALVEAAEPHLWGPDDAQWMDRLEMEHENLRAALRWTVGRGEAEIAQRFGAALCRFWRVRGHATEGRRWLESALAWSSGSSSATRARALEAAGHLARDRGDYNAAEAFYSQCLALRREIGDSRGIALALNNLGFAAQFRGDPDLAATLQQESLSMFRQMNDRQGIALSLITLGTLAQLQGDPEKATAAYEEGLALFRELDDKHGIAASLNNLGNLASASHDYPSAEGFYEGSKALFHELGDQHEVAACLSNLAGVAVDLGDEPRALMLYRDSLRLYAALGNKHGIATCLTLLADIAFHRGEAEQAVRLVAAAESIHATAGTISVTVASSNRDRLISTIQPLLGNKRFATAWEMGRSLTLDEAIDLALDSVVDRADPDASPTFAGSLTPRQREIATLIAEGLTNRQIAEMLFIAERTVDTHVEHILARLDVRSRTQVAVWAAECGLVSRT